MISESDARRRGGPPARWLLAIDTSSEQASVALYDGHRLAETTWPAGRDQTTSVLAEIDRLRELAGAAVTEIAAVAVATGPGMFNGLRVGMSIAKGFVLGLDLPLIGCSTLAVAVHPFASFGRPVTAVVPAGRGRLVWADYHGLDQTTAPRNGAIAELVAHVATRHGQIVAGELSDEQARSLLTIPGTIVPPRSARRRRAAALAEIGWTRFIVDDVDDAVSLEPVYVHAPAPAPASAQRSPPATWSEATASQRSF